MQKTPLDGWIQKRILGPPGHELTREDIRRYQLEKLRTVIDYVIEKSPFYRERLAGLSGRSLSDPEDLSAFPFTTVQDLHEYGAQFLCLSQSQVERVVTIGHPQARDAFRRFFFSEADLELTIDFFHHGMMAMVKPGETVLILLAGDKPGSVGDLLVKALRRGDVQGIVQGIVVDPARTIDEVVRKRIDCLVGIPTQVLALARREDVGKIPKGQIKSVLLAGDYVPSAVVSELTRVWGCQVFTAYTPTAMGYGGGVECEALAGYHLREADHYYEIVNPVSSMSKAPGESGEIVVTTLTRTAMPLIRYRTGEMSRFLSDPCPCGTVLRRMDKVKGRASDMVKLPSGSWIGIADLDEALFPLGGIVNYYATLTRNHQMDRLEIEICCGSKGQWPASETVITALQGVHAIGDAVRRGCLILEPVRYTDENRVTTCAIKRGIVQRNEKECRDEPGRTHCL